MLKLESYYGMTEFACMSHPILLIFQTYEPSFSSSISNNSARFSSGTGSSCSSVPQSPGSSIASPFHEAKASNPYDVSEYQPLNVIDGKKKYEKLPVRKISLLIVFSFFDCK